MRRFLVLFFGLGLAALASGDILNLDDPLYRQLDTWQVRAMISPLPSFRPFSVQLVLARLDELENCAEATAEDHQLAQSWRKDLTESVHFEAEVSTWVLDSSVAAVPHGSFITTHLVDANLSTVAAMDVRAADTATAALAVPGSGAPYDYTPDDGHVVVGGRTWNLWRDPRGEAAVGGAGGTGFSAQLGFSRNSFGPISDDGLIVGSTSPDTGHLGVNYQGNGVQYLQYMLVLASRYNNGVSGRSDKYLYYHEIIGTPIPQLDLSFFESVIGGGSLNLLYFLPMSIYFNSQGLSNYGDNSFMGLSAVWRFQPGWRAAGVLYMDDLQFNDMAALQLNTKWKVAFQGELQYAGGPGSSPWMPLMTTSYTAIMPYTYTHMNSLGDLGPNYEVYTNGDSLLGSALQPNSDRLRFKAVWHSADATVTLQRHGNASTGIIPGGDGTINDPGWLNGSPTYTRPFVDPTGQPYTRFLTQSVIETRLQAGASWNGSWEPSFASLFGQPLAATWGASLTGELVWNDALVSGAFASHLYATIHVGSRW